MAKISRSTSSAQIGIRRPSPSVREIYDDGRRLLNCLPERGSGKNRYAVIREFANKKGLNTAELHKRMLFAEQYDTNTLQELLEFNNLTWSHVRKLLTVSDRTKRSEFAKQANDQSWSPRRLICEIEADQGVKNTGGRLVKTREFTPGTLYLVRQDFLRLQSSLNAYNESPVPDSQLDGLFRQNLSNAIMTLEKLQEKLGGFLKRLRSIQRKLKQTKRNS